MAFERPLKIREVVENIDKRKYYLPAIQREFIWTTNQIARLFDSLMRDYPIGSFLFWDVTKEQIKTYQFYEFIRDYHERDRTHNPKANISGGKDIIAILDGQQRLTSLYLGLKGTYSYKLPRKRWDTDSAFPERKLFLNLTKKSDDNDLEYGFRFITDKEASRDAQHWFRVGEILNLQEEYEVNNYLIDHALLGGDKEQAQFANKTLFKLHAVVHRNEIINYYLEKDNKLDKVLNIFIRVNSGGTFLSYSDLLLSIATAQWQEKDAREVITKFVDELNNIGDGFNFDKDFVLKTCLVLNDFSKIAFKVDNFNRENMLKIEENWDRISDSLRLAVSLVSSYGYNSQTLTSNNAIIPIAYYLFKNDSPINFVHSSIYKDDRGKIQKWLIYSLLKRAFGGQPDAVLRPIRRIISDNPSPFPFNEIIDRFRGLPKSIVFGSDDIENLFFYKYRQRYTFSTLVLLYPTLDLRNRFHIDHIFPRSLFTKNKLENKGIEREKIDFYLDNYDCLANLQLIEGTSNLEKLDKDFEEWIYEQYPGEQEKKDYMRKHYIPDIDLNLNNFDEFFRERKKLLAQAFNSILNVSTQQIDIDDSESNSHYHTFANSQKSKTSDSRQNGEHKELLDRESLDLEIKEKDYQQIGYEAGIRLSKTLSSKDCEYILAVNRPGCQAYREGDTNAGVSVVLDSFRKGATIEEVVQKLILQKNQKWSSNRILAEKYVYRMITDLNTKYFYGWLLSKEGDKYLLKKAMPRELCYAKYGNKESIPELNHEQKEIYLKGWFDGVLDELKIKETKKANENDNQFESEMDIIKNSEVLSETYRKCSEKMQLLFKKLITECKGRYGNLKTAELPQIRLAREFKKPTKSKIDENYCIFELFPKLDCIRMHINLITGVQLQMNTLKQIESNLESGKGWQAFEIYDHDDLKYALVILKDVYYQILK